MRQQRIDAPPLELDRARARSQKPEHDLEQRRLAGAVGADDGDDLAPPQHEVEPGEDVDLRNVARDDAFDLDERPGRWCGAHATSWPCAPRYASITRRSRRTSLGRPLAITRPNAMTTTRSALFITTSMSCSMKRNVSPSLERSSCMWARICAPSTGLTPARGSSRSTTRGRAISSRANSRSLRWPPDSVPA